MSPLLEEHEQLDPKLLCLLFASILAVTLTTTQERDLAFQSFDPLLSFSLSVLSLSLYYNLSSSLILLSIGCVSQLLVLVLTVE
jgi:hypothetical protein